MESTTHHIPQSAGHCKHCSTGTEVPSFKHTPTCPNYISPVFPSRCNECNAVGPKVGDQHEKDCSNYLPF